MSLTRQQLRAKAASARYQAGKKKPPTRAQVQSWLKPIRRAVLEMMGGEVDAIRGYAVTRLHEGDDYARVDWCINGFVALLERLTPDIDITPLHSVSRKLANGIPLTLLELHECLALLRQCEDRLIKLPRSALMDAATLEQVAIEVERLGLREAA
jgi:hypothetical protein